MQAPEGKAEVVKDSPWKARMRYAKIGGAAVAGGAILGLTGGAGVALAHCLIVLHPPNAFRCTQRPNQLLSACRWAMSAGAFSQGLF